jgi:hypothetical protein
VVHYSGLRTSEGPVVSLVEGRMRRALLVPSFATTATRAYPWDWGGEGEPSTLALAILWDATGHQRQLALAWVPAFCTAVVAQLPRARFALARRAVQDWIVAECCGAIQARHLGEPREGPQ